MDVNPINITGIETASHCVLERGIYRRFQLVRPKQGTFALINKKWPKSIKYFWCVSKWK